ncbi:ferritin-like domain-containing protein [Saccharopolyspora sp. NPDC000995]
MGSDRATGPRFRAHRHFAVAVTYECGCEEDRARASRAQNLLEEQVGNELNASQQYLACAVWFDQRNLPRLAA